MKDTNTLLERFFKVAKVKPTVKPSAGRSLTRKMVEREVQNARTAHGTSSRNLAEMRAAHKELGNKISKCELDISGARTKLKRHRDILDTMDIADCSGVKYMSDDDIAYIKGGKLFRIEERDGEMHLVPYKKKYNTKSKEEKGDKKESPSESDCGDAGECGDADDVSYADDENYAQDDTNDIDNFIRSLM